MQRSAIIGSVYGYLVCLLAILLFVHSGARSVDGIFGVVNPTMSAHHRGSMTGTRDRRHMRPWGAPVGIGAAQASAATASRWPTAAGNGRENARAAMVANARMRAARDLAVNLILLVVAVLLFRWHWKWLHNGQMVSSPAPA
ncbi:MAG: hypothetical protein WB615_11270 [Candidatus Tumulicola sp.]